MENKQILLPSLPENDVNFKKCKGENIMERILLSDDADINEIEEALDEAGIDYNWDSGDRLMVSGDDLEDVTAILDELTDYDII